MTFTVVPNINLQVVDYADAKESVQEVPQFIGEGAKLFIVNYKIKTIED
jgi:hypothetical protein